MMLLPAMAAGQDDVARIRAEIRMLQNRIADLEKQLELIERAKTKAKPRRFGEAPRVPANDQAVASVKAFLAKGNKAGDDAFYLAQGLKVPTSDTVGTSKDLDVREWTLEPLSICIQFASDAEGAWRFVVAFELKTNRLVGWEELRKRIPR
jgi:hypothetical protein